MKIGAIREMKIVYIKLTGYIGIFNGLGLNELEIDLSQSKHKIIVISGINGSGKTTLLKAMSIIPDGSSDFTPGVNAEKLLRIIDNDILYEIRLTSSASKNGRGTSKASILKNGIELNPNGNIGSYLETIFQEFELDSNFITLSRLSGEDRGLADKGPAERKKFMASIVDSLETYNGIYKNLNKKSSVFKSYVNNFHAKIQSVGDEDNIRNCLSSLESKKASLFETMDSLKAFIAQAKAVLSINDPKGTMQTEYAEIESNIRILTESVNESFKHFKRVCDRLGINPGLNEVESMIASKDTLIHTHENNLEDSNRIRLSLIEKRESIVSELESKRRKISELQQGVDSTLVSVVSNLKEKVRAEEDILHRMGIVDIDNTSKEELQFIFNTINSLVETITNQLYLDMTDDIIQSTMYFSMSELNKAERDLNAQQELINQLEDEVKEVQKDLELIQILSNRPASCKINDCHFISTAYQLQNTKYNGRDVEKVFAELAEQLKEATIKQVELADRYQMLMFAGSKKELLKHIDKTVRMNADILKKCSVGVEFINSYEQRISTLDPFNDFKDMQSLIGDINTISIYKQDSSALKTLEAQWIAQRNAEGMIHELSEEVIVLEGNLEKVTVDFNGIAKEISHYNDLLSNLRSGLIACEEAKNHGEVWFKKKTQLDMEKARLDEIIRKSEASISLLSNIEKTKVELKNITEQVAQIDSQLSRLNGQMVMLESYKVEYEKYSHKYNMVDKLKKYSSPTKGGIQTLFMSIYMNKTLELANQVLSLVFGNQYRILDYVINANEFRIPFVGSGLVVDDISSGSTSQVCMMGMALSLVLLYQASTKYNITRLDEIDGGLDTMNRMRFIDALYKIIEILNIDQVFVISHSLELEFSNVDMIRLRTYSSEIPDNSNVLYDFQASTLQ